MNLYFCITVGALVFTALWDDFVLDTVLLRDLLWSCFGCYQFMLHTFIQSISKTLKKSSLHITSNSQESCKIMTTCFQKRYYLLIFLLYYYDTRGVAVSWRGPKIIKTYKNGQKRSHFLKVSDITTMILSIVRWAYQILCHLKHWLRNYSHSRSDFWSF